MNIKKIIILRDDKHIFSLLRLEHSDCEKEAQAICDSLNYYAYGTIPYSYKVVDAFLR